MGTNLPPRTNLFAHRTALRELGFTDDPYYLNAMISPSGCVWVTLDGHQGPGPDGIPRIGIFVFGDPTGMLLREMRLTKVPVDTVVALVEQLDRDGLVHSS